MSVLGKIIFYSMLVLIAVISTLIILILAIGLSGSGSVVLSRNTAPVANLGGAVLLSCYLFTTSVTEVSVTWAKVGSGGVVYKYQAGAAELGQQDPGFKGRTQLFPDDVASGNVSLLVRSVKRSDQGDYTCTISSSAGSGTVQVHLRTAAYTTPVITRSGSTLTALASRWFPKPNVTWLNAEEQVLQATTDFTQITNNIFSVSSSLPRVNVSETYTCKIENNLVISVSTATVTVSSVNSDSYFSFSAASAHLSSLHLTISSFSLFCLCWLT